MIHDIRIYFPVYWNTLTHFKGVTHQLWSDWTHYCFKQFYNLQIDEFGVCRGRRAIIVVSLCVWWMKWNLSIWQALCIDVRCACIAANTLCCAYVTSSITIWHGFDPMWLWRLDGWRHIMPTPTISITDHTVTAKFNWNNSVTSPFSV